MYAAFYLILSVFTGSLCTANYKCVLLPQSSDYTQPFHDVNLIYSAVHLKVYGILTDRTNNVQWGDTTAV